MKYRYINIDIMIWILENKKSSLMKQIKRKNNRRKKDKELY